MARQRLEALDDIDRHLCYLLADDPRCSRRELAALVGLTDETVAARLRQLRQNNVIATTVTVDWEAAGYQTGVIVRLSVRGGQALPALRAVFGNSHVVFAALTAGCCDAVLSLVAVDLPALRADVGRIAENLERFRIDATDVVTSTKLYNPNAHTLPLTPWSSSELPDPHPVLDPLDQALIDELIVAGDQSNREIARRLNVSDGTVRARLRRLEDSGLLRIVTARDPVVFGDLVEHALAFVTIDDPATVDDLVTMPGVQSVYETVGSADVVLAVAAATANDLSRLLTRDLRRVPGVARVETAHVVTVVQHRTHLVRLTGPSPAVARPERARAIV